MRHALILFMCLYGLTTKLSAAPLGTTFTYQGRITDAGTPLNGAADFKFSLWDAAAGGSQIGGILTRTGVGVAEGTFSVTLDFGDSVFTGDARWLAIEVRSPAGSGSYTPLTPRQALNATPYALHAANGNWSPVSNGIEYTGDDTVWIKPPDGDTSGAKRTLALQGARNGGANPIATIDIHNIDNNNSNTLYLAAQISSKNQGASDHGDLNFFTRDDVLTQKMTIAPNGDVGIGIAEPQARLHVDGGDVRFSGGDFSLERGSVDSSLTRAFTIGGARDQGGTAYATLQFQNYDSGATASDYIGAKITSHNASGDDSGDLRLFAYDGAFNLGVTIAPDGDVGIGKGNPNSELDVNGRTITNELKVADGILVPAGGIRNGGNRPATDDMGIYSVLNGAWVRFVSNNGYFLFYTDSSTGTGDTANPDMAAMVITNQDWVGIGTSAPQEKLEVAGNIRADVLVLDGGADLSERFDVHGAAKPGVVVSIDPKHPGQLAVASQAYDHRVAGIISGAGDVATGLMLGQHNSIADGEHPVALNGRVYCWCDASTAPIEPGDLLTTSDIPGHAMKVCDYNRAHGAILGKAMTALPTGRGLVLVLVNLQ